MITELPPRLDCAADTKRNSSRPRAESCTPPRRSESNYIEGTPTTGLAGQRITGEFGELAERQEPFGIRTRPINTRGIGPALATLHSVDRSGHCVDRGLGWVGTSVARRVLRDVRDSLCRRERGPQGCQKRQQMVSVKRGFNSAFASNSDIRPPTLSVPYNARFARPRRRTHQQ